MNKWYYFIIIFSICRISSAQNLVPNWSFEDTMACPTNPGQVSNAPPWHRPTSGTSDYFNQCNKGSVGVPINQLGYQFARTGVAYMGLFTGYGTYREYISAPLMDTLKPGVKYFVSLFVSFNCFGNFPCSPSGTDALGVYFSHGSPDTTNVFNRVLRHSPQISNKTGNILSDTLNWTKISGEFIATGNENYITIGNFRNDTNSLWGYYYVDDVCISADSLTCNPISESINDFWKKDEALLFPNPFQDKINIAIQGSELEFYLYDVTARVILKKSFSNSISINTEQLAKGVYLYEIRNESEVIKSGKVVKE